MNRIFYYLKTLYLKFRLRNNRINARGLYLQNYIKEQLMDETKERNPEYEEIISAVARSQGYNNSSTLYNLIHFFSFVYLQFLLNIIMLLIFLS